MIRFTYIKDYSNDRTLSQTLSVLLASPYVLQFSHVLFLTLLITEILVIYINICNLPAEIRLFNHDCLNILWKHHLTDV